MRVVRRDGACVGDQLSAAEMGQLKLERERGNINPSGRVTLVLERPRWIRAHDCSNRLPAHDVKTVVGSTVMLSGLKPTLKSINKTCAAWLAPGSVVLQ